MFMKVSVLKMMVARQNDIIQVIMMFFKEKMAMVRTQAKTIRKHKTMLYLMSLSVTIWLKCRPAACII